MHKADKDDARHRVVDRQAAEDALPAPEGCVSAEHGTCKDAGKLAEDVSYREQLAGPGVGDVVKQRREPGSLEAMGAHPESQQDGDAETALRAADAHQAQSRQRSAQEPGSCVKSCYKVVTRADGNGTRLKRLERQGTGSPAQLPTECFKDTIKAVRCAGGGVHA